MDRGDGWPPLYRLLLPSLPLLLASPRHRMTFNVWKLKMRTAS